MHRLAPIPPYTHAHTHCPTHSPTFLDARLCFLAPHAASTHMPMHHAALTHPRSRSPDTLQIHRTLHAYPRLPVHQVPRTCQHATFSTAAPAAQRAPADGRAALRRGVLVRCVQGARGGQGAHRAAGRGAAPRGGAGGEHPTGRLGAGASWAHRPLTLDSQPRRAPSGWSGVLCLVRAHCVCGVTTAASRNHAGVPARPAAAAHQAYAPEILVR